MLSGVVVLKERALSSVNGQKVAFGKLNTAPVSAAQ